MDAQKKKLVIVGVLLIVLIVSWTVVLKLKKLPGTAGAPASAAGSQVTVTTAQPAERVNLAAFEEGLSRLRKGINEVEGGTGASVQVAFERDPMDAWKRQAKPVQGGFVPVKTILRSGEATDMPDFVLSGVVYDKEKPLAVIDNEVKGESELKQGYLVYRILPDRVLLKRNDRIYVLMMNSGKAVDGGSRLALSDETAGGGDSNLVREERPSAMTNPPLPFRIRQDLPAVASAQAGYGGQVWERGWVRGAAVIPPSPPSAPIEGEELWGRERVKQAGRREAIPARAVKTVQFCSYGTNGMEQAIEAVRVLQERGYQDVRAERIDGIYTVRIGVFDREENIRSLCKELRRFSRTSFIRTAYYRQERIVYPRPQDETHGEPRATG